MSPIAFEINVDKTYKDECCGESYAVLSCYAKEKNVGPVNILQDQ